MLNIFNLMVFGILIFIIYNFLLFHYSSSLVKGKKEHMQNYSSSGLGFDQSNLDLHDFLKKLEFHSANKRSSLLNTVAPIEKTIHARTMNNNLVMSTNPLDASDYTYYTQDKERNIINNSHRKSQENNQADNKRPSSTQDNLPAPRHYNSNGFINLLSSMFFPTHNRPHHRSHHSYHNHRHYRHHSHHHTHYPSNYPHHTRGQEYHHHRHKFF